MAVSVSQAVTAAATEGQPVVAASGGGQHLRLGPAQPGPTQGPDHLGRADLARPGGHGGRIVRGRQVVVVAVEGPRGHTDPVGEGVQLGQRGVGHQVGEHRAVGGPQRRVDEEHRIPAGQGREIRTGWRQPTRPVSEACATLMAWS
ncbi:hypothetical protein SDC9_118988 [bioreactor metagenome]|uniref:Uncharacterized protein n=1 Tax=bioreactor metagenome TaxID=1076179 RepID=A0A645C396_9ZZZZ